MGRCGVNPKNHTPCATKPLLNESNIRDLRAALHGQRVGGDGSVDHTSPSTTPHLQLHVVTYDSQLSMIGRGQPLFDAGLIDGISLWINGHSQGKLHANLTAIVSDVRARVAPSVSVYTGGYLLHSEMGWLRPAPFYDLLRQSLTMYDDNRVQGFYTFAGNALSRMNASLWAEWALPTHLAEMYTPWIGTAMVRVVDAATGHAVSAALIEVWYNVSTLTARKRTDAEGTMKFGGWCGQAHAVPHTLRASAAGYAGASATVQLERNGVVHAVLRLSKSGAPSLPPLGASLTIRPRDGASPPSM